MIELTPLLDLHSKTPLYVQLYHYIKQEIENGNLTSGTRLPSIRQLSQHLQVSKNTIEGAYQQLIAEGYVESIPRIGLRVLLPEEPLAFNAQANPKWQLVSQEIQEPLEASPSKRNSHSSECRIMYDFVYGDIDMEHFPIKIWRKYLNEALISAPTKELMYGDLIGVRGLRQELSHYLLQARGFTCSPDQIVLCAGTQHAVSLLCQLLSLHGSSVAMEDPGYDGVRSVFINHSCQMMPIPLEADGISLASLAAVKAKLLYITPSHQLPYGMILPVQKRVRLLNWAHDNDSYILEDDYDSEFRYQGQPIPALKALDKKEQVIYLGTFSKCFLPAIRISYLVLPPKLVHLYRQKLHNYNQAASPILQRALYLLMKNGDFERHIRRMRKVYQTKHRTLLAAIEQHFGQQVEIIGERSGLHILLRVPGRKDQELIEQAREYGVQVYSTSKFWYNRQLHDPSTIMLGFGSLSVEEIEEGVRLLKEAWFNY